MTPSSPRERMPSDSTRDFGAEHRDLTDRAAALPGVDEVVKIYADYQRQLLGAAALARASVPRSSATAGTSF